MKSFTVHIIAGSGESAGDWLWYVDRADEPCMHGVEPSTEEAAAAAFDSLCFLIDSPKVTERT